MEPARVSSPEDLRSLIGSELGPSEWLETTQERIDAFAEVSGDRQWIHVDPERAARESPFGTTIAHGDLTLALLETFRPQLVEYRNVRLGVKYGWDRIRFPAAVPVGSRIRARGEVVTVEEVGEGWWHVVTRFTVEREGGDKPVCVAEGVGRVLFEAD
jgi:acyl dehydratase